MLTIILIITCFIVIYGSAIVWCIKTDPRRLKKPTRKMLKQRQETIDILDYKLSTEYRKLKIV